MVMKKNNHLTNLKQDQWRDGFLLQTIKNAYTGLKPGKYAGFNVANVKSYKILKKIF